MNIAIVSGGFDPIHSGHIDNIIEANKKVGPVIVILNSDNWLIRKKGAVFMDWNNRAEICRNIKGVIDVIEAKDNDNTVCESLRELKLRFPNETLVFCKGGDRVKGNTPEDKLCHKIGILTLYGVGGEKLYSSRQFLKKWKTSSMRSDY